MNNWLFSMLAWLPARAKMGWAASMLGFAVTGAVQANISALIPSPPDIPSKSFVLMDCDSDAVLAAKTPHKTMHPASLTKMMTAYISEAELAAGHIQREDTVRISEKAWSMGGSTMFIEVGEQVPVEELLKGMIIVSGNDASVAMAEHIAGSEDAFVQIMNRTAKRLNMQNTHFTNAAGWPDQAHYSSAYDLAVLSKHVIRDYPDYYGLYQQKYYQYGTDKKTGRPLDKQANRNQLLWTNAEVDGLKTGYIEAIGYSLAVTAKRDDRRLIAVLLGAKTERQRADEAQKLLSYGFRFFENVPIKKGGEALQTVPVWKGNSNKITVGIDNDLVVTVPRGTGKKLKASLWINADLVAPITANQTVGSIKVTLDNRTVSEVPLLAQQAVAQGNVFKRTWDSILLFFKRLFA